MLEDLKSSKRLERQKQKEQEGPPVLSPNAQENAALQARINALIGPPKPPPVPEEPLAAEEEKQIREAEDERVQQKQELYEQCLASAKDMWEEFTTGNKYKKKKEEQERDRLEKAALNKKLGIVNRDQAPSLNRGSTMSNGGASGSAAKAQVSSNFSAYKPPQHAKKQFYSPMPTTLKLEETTAKLQRTEEAKPEGN